MEDVVLDVYLKSRYWVKRFLRDERGDVNIVSIVIIIGIVVMLAGVFREQISRLVNDLLLGITSEASKAGAAK